MDDKNDVMKVRTHELFAEEGKSLLNAQLCVIRNRSRAREGGKVG